MRQSIANQGEVRIDRIAALPETATKPFTEKNGKGWIISHSETGHHHILGGDCDVMERVDVPTGARILYAIVKEPTLALVFLNPLYFMLLFLQDLRDRARVIALVLGGALGAPFHLLTPEWGLLAASLVGGTLAAAISRHLRQAGG